MRVIGLTDYGDPKVPRPSELPEPHTGPAQVRLWVRAARVTPGRRDAAAATARRDAPLLTV